MCLYPVKMYRYVSRETGETLRSFKPIPVSALGYEVIDLPCGKCVECCESYSREWSFRIMHEAQKYDKNCCLTLTYNDMSLPVGSNVVKRDYQLFLKRVRKHYGSVRYFGCAEYGGKTFRPHYHIILFGFDFDDMYFWSKSKSGQDLFRSRKLDMLWSYHPPGIKCSRCRLPYGHAYIGRLDIRTAKYCSKYLQKLAYDNIPELQFRERPFTFMSTHPGIGGDYHICLETDKLYFSGHYVKTPRYYLKQAERDGFDLSSIRSVRLSKARLLKPDFVTLSNRRKKAKRLIFEHSHLRL